jgi:hypothetical protein
VSNFHADLNATLLFIQVRVYVYPAMNPKDKLTVETSHEPCWHHYTNDDYGEDREGKAFLNGGNGIRRA